MSNPTILNYNSVLHQMRLKTTQTTHPSTLSLLLLLPTLLILSQSALLFEKSSSFGTIQIKLTTTTGFISASSDNSFQIANPSYTNINSIGLALCGYDIPPSTALQFRSQGSYDEQTNSFIIVVLATDSTTFYFLNYFLMVTTNEASTYLYIDNPCISSNYNISNPGYYNRSYQFTITGPFTINSTTVITSIPFLRSMNSVANSTYNYYNITSMQYINNQVIIYVFLNYSLVSEVCLSIIYFNQALASTKNVFLNTSFAQNMFLNATVITQTLGSASQQTFGINSIYGPSYVPKCVVGFRAVKWLSASRQTLSFNMTGSGVYDLITGNTYELNYNWFCGADIKCPSSNYQYYPVINECQPICTIANCSVCSTSTSCQICQAGYYLSVLYRCLPCMSNCQNCTNSTVCIFCNNGYYYNPITASCAPCSLYCNTCTISQCTSCLEGYFSSSTSCVKCSTMMSGCLLCSSGSYCNTCPNGTFFNSGMCQSCSVRSLGCINCNAFYCFGCATGYFLSASNCVACTIAQTECCGFFVANCVTCLTVTTCKSCKVGYYLGAQATCLNCSIIPNCQACSDSSTCTACNIGYVLNGVACSSCSVNIANCQSCQNVSYCLICTPPFLSVNGLCYNCTSWPTNDLFYLDSFYNCISCTTVTSNCVRCNSSNSCTICNSLYFLANNNCLLCSQSIPQCLSCVSASICSICGNGYYLNPNNPASCLLCSSQISNCLSCSSTYFNALNSWVLSCTRCQPEYFINKTTCSSCTAVIPFCLVCINNYQCRQCSSYYYLSSTLSCINCQTLMPGCISCNSSQCQSCALGYYLVNSYCTLCSMAVNYCKQCSPLNSNITCQLCLPGYYLATQFTCMACNSTLPFCTLCVNSSACIACLPGYASSLTNSTCYPCSTLIPNCLYCNSDLACQKCLQNYLLDPNGQCKSCNSYIDGCDKCAYVTDIKSNATSLNCTVCFSGYLGYFNNNLTKCIACNVSIFYCSSCMNLTYCKICSNVSFLNEKGSCSLCSLYLSNCLYCSNNSVCTSCAPGYFSSANSSCLPCDPLQFGMTSAQLPICKQCKYLNNIAHCLACQIGYYSQSHNCGLCSSVLPFCAECQSSTLCQSCQSGYYLSEHWQCLQCKSNLANCSSCSADGICLQCYNTFYLNSSLNQCIRCSSVVSNCLTCTNNKTCLSCQDGFYLSDNVCINCSSVLSDCVYCYNATHCALKVASGSSSSRIATLNWYIYFIVILMIIALIVVGIIWWRKVNPPLVQKHLEKTGMVSDTQRELIQQNKEDGATGLVDEIRVQHKICQGCKTKPAFWMNLELLCRECESKPGRDSTRKIKQEFKKKQKRVKSQMKEQLYFQELAINPPKVSEIEQKVRQSHPANSSVKQKSSMDILVHPPSEETNNLELYSKVDPEPRNTKSQPQEIFERQRSPKEGQKGNNKMKSQFG